MILPGEVFCKFTAIQIDQVELSIKGSMILLGRTGKLQATTHQITNISKKDTPNYKYICLLQKDMFVQH